MNTSAEPTAYDVVKKTLNNLKKIGSEAQRRGAEEIERQLQGGAQAVNFARGRGKNAKQEGGK